MQILVRFSNLICTFTRHLVQPLVSGVPGACYLKYASEAQAFRGFSDALQEGSVSRI
jgi:hypothetical protein